MYVYTYIYIFTYTSMHTCKISVQYVYVCIYVLGAFNAPNPKLKTATKKKGLDQATRGRPDAGRQDGRGSGEGAGVLSGPVNEFQ